jgi:uncharacterized protein YndB with AHSA1/START domain
MTVSKSEARAVADLTEGTIVAMVEIAAPVERVFRALTTDEITRWWGSDDMYRTTKFTADVRPGGRWRSDGIGAAGDPFHVEGEFRVVEPPHKLVQTWKAGWDGDNETVITYKLESVDGGTRLTLRHDGFGDRVASCAGHASGWERVLGWLVAFVAPVAPPKFYFCRLVPPRPSFAGDMDAAEADVMKKHAQYWRGMMAEGHAIVFGPVADPAGPWGLGILRAADDAEFARLRDRDPAILSGRGFRYDTLPMMMAVVR